MNIVNVEFTQEDLNAISALLDAAVKATGIQGAKAALPIMAKLEDAVSAANQPKANETEEGHA